MKTAKEYQESMMWNGGNTTEEKINWILADYKQSIIGLIDEMIEEVKDSNNYADEFAYNLLTDLKEKLK